MGTWCMYMCVRAPTHARVWSVTTKWTVKKCLLVCLGRVRRDSHVEFLTNDVLVQAQYISGHRLEVGGGVVRVADETTISCAVIARREGLADCREPLDRWAHQPEGRRELLFRVVGLDGGARYRDEAPLGCNAVRAGHHADIDIVAARLADGRRGDDQLHRVFVVGLRNRVVEEAYCNQQTVLLHLESCFYHC